MKVVYFFILSFLIPCCGLLAESSSRAEEDCVQSTSALNGEMSNVTSALLKEQEKNLLKALISFNDKNNQNKDKLAFLHGFSKTLRKHYVWSSELAFPQIVYNYLNNTPDAFMPPGLLKVFPDQGKWINFLKSRIEESYKNGDSQVLEKMIYGLNADLTQKNREALVQSLRSQYGILKPRKGLLGYAKQIFSKRAPYELLAVGAALGDERAFERGEAILEDYIKTPVDDDYMLAGYSAITHFESSNQIVIDRKRDLIRALDEVTRKQGKNFLFQAGD